MRNGTIFEFKNVMENDNEPETLLQSHYDGEVWGLDLVDGGKKLLTTGDDNKIMLIDAETMKVERSSTANGPVEMCGDYKDLKCTASSMGVYSPEK
jgi:WD40 repeat protein|tara:strand:+ start:1246 stop:1533 length:288 start_codon:yes stop_codon:yes gene_type:complete